MIKTKLEIRNDLTHLLNEPNFGKDNTKSLTIIGKKCTLTKWIKSAEEHLKSITEAHNRPKLRDRYYLGDFITSVQVLNERTELEVMKEMRKELDKK